MHLFYHPEIKGEQHTLDAEESAHCVKVLRLRENDIVYLTNGKGSLFKSVISLSNPKKCELQIIETLKDYKKPDYLLHIAIAPTKNIERFEWFLEKATEIGISRITPIICERSERRIIKPQRLKKILVTAMKQSLKTYLPVLDNQVDLPGFLDQNQNGLRFLADFREIADNHLFEKCKPGVETTVLVGPEGDFTEREFNLAHEKGFQSVSLGDSRLRTETAGIVACHTVYLCNNAKG